MLGRGPRPTRIRLASTRLVTAIMTSSHKADAMHVAGNNPGLTAGAERYPIPPALFSTAKGRTSPR